MSGYLNITINDQNQVDPIAGAKIIITEYHNRNRVVKVVETNSAGQVNFVELDSNANRFSPSPYKKYDLIVQIPPIPDRYTQPQEYVKSGVQIWESRVTNNQDEFVQIKKFESMPEETRNNEIKLEENSIVEPEVDKIYQNPFNIPDPEPVSPPGVFYMFSPTKVPFVPTELDIYIGTASPYIHDSRVNNKRIIKENYIKYLKIVSAQEFGGIPKLTEEAAIANLLLVNSFALNRVYTEMYRNKGYNFNITNSTIFDQHYPIGGNTFQNVDALVDKYFNQYIRLKGKIQPLLAQYCAGKSGSCKNKGVPQIGLNNRSLKNPDLSHADLLKHFYDQLRIEFEIVTAEVVEGNPKSYPGYPLKLGMKESSINTIQEFLFLIRTKYDQIPTLEVSGEFDNKTFDAVMKFQNLFEKGKKDKGVVDEATWYRMSTIYVEITKAVEPRERYMHAFMY